GRPGCSPAGSARGARTRRISPPATSRLPLLPGPVLSQLLGGRNDDRLAGVKPRDESFQEPHMNPLPFVGPSYSLALKKADIQRSINLHLVGLESPGKAPFILNSVPGYSVFANPGVAIRGCLTTND